MAAAALGNAWVRADRVRCAYWWVAAAMVVLMAASLLLEPAMRRALFAESGPVEIATAVGFLAGALLALASGQRHKLRHGAVLLLLFTARELDFDKRFTAVGILKSRFFASADVPLLQKLAGALVLLVLVWSVLGLLRKFTRAWLAGLVRRDVASVGIGLALLCLVVAKAIDGLERKLLPLGIQVSQQVAQHAGVLEEILESGAATYIVLALVVVLHAPAPGGREPA